MQGPAHDHRDTDSTQPKLVPASAPVSPDPWRAFGTLPLVSLVLVLARCRSPYAQLFLSHDLVCGNTIRVRIFMPRVKRPLHSYIQGFPSRKNTPRPPFARARPSARRRDGRGPFPPSLNPCPSTHVEICCRNSPDGAPASPTLI